LVLGPAALISGAVPSISQSALAQGLDPASAIQHFYLSVATYQYEEAYAMLSEGFQARHPYQSWVDGYDETAFVQVETGAATGDADTATVPVTITAWHNDGSIHTFGGTYTLVSVGTAWIIDTAEIEERDTPAKVPPLMRFADIEVGLGPGGAGAGHRYYSLLVTNVSDATVTAAGIPQLGLRDASGSTIVESEGERLDAIAAVSMPPGESAEALFEWSNWCDAEPDAPLVVTVSLPGEVSAVEVPFSGPEGDFQAPPCMGDAEPTAFRVRAFEPVRQ
jgi:hypothetical protein